VALAHRLVSRANVYLGARRERCDVGACAKTRRDIENTDCETGCCVASAAFVWGAIKHICIFSAKIPRPIYLLKFLVSQQVRTCMLSIFKSDD
jgi:hypothetical protein